MINRLLRHGLNKKSGHNIKGVITVRHKERGHKKKHYIKVSANTILNTYSTLLFKLKNNRNLGIYLNSKGIIYLNHIRSVQNKYVISNHKNWRYEGDGNCYTIGALSKNSVCKEYSNLAKAMGSTLKVLYHQNGYTIVQLPSKEIKLVSSLNLTQTGSDEKVSSRRKKAGVSRWLGNRPSVRGVAMNPVDHPHGGGEGKSKGVHSKSKWGVHTKGKKTVLNVKKNKWILSL